MTASRALALAAAALAGACALPLDEGRGFRQRLAGTTGQPVSVLLDELGPNEAEVTTSGRRYAWALITIGNGRPSGECLIEIDVDERDTIIAARMQGSDYICGSHILRLRREAALHRADPGLRARQDAEMRRRLEELVRLRRILAEDGD